MRPGQNDCVIFDQDDLDLIAALAGCSLDESPGSNWVQRAGGLPEYICQIARAIKRTGKTTSQAIAIAVSRVKKWAAGADDVNADTRAKAAKALAEWEAKKARTVAASATGLPGPLLCLSVAEFNTEHIRAAFDTRQRKIRQTWRAANPNTTYDEGPQSLYVKELWTTYLIAQSMTGGEGRHLYKIPYSVDAANQVTFGEAVQVTTTYVTVSPQEIGDDGTLSDTDLRALMNADTPAAHGATDKLVQAAGGTSSALDRVLNLNR